MANAMESTYVSDTLSYLLDPSTAVAHLLAGGLLHALCRQGVSLPRVLVLGALEELVLWVLWVLVRHSLGAVLALWLFIHVYEAVVAGRLEISENAVFVIGKMRINSRPSLL